MMMPARTGARSMSLTDQKHEQQSKEYGAADYRAAGHTPASGRTMVPDARGAMLTLRLSPGMLPLPLSLPSLSVYYSACQPWSSIEGITTDAAG